MKPWEIISKLESDNSRLAKESILKDAVKANNIEFFEGVSLALNSFHTFGVKKVPLHSGPDGQGLPWDAFKKLAELLINRELTGHDARDAIELQLATASKDQWNNWYRRILIRDLRCGVTEKTVNKVLKGTKIPSIPVFECQLAEDSADHEKKLTGIKLAEPKLDGVRCLTIINVENKTVIQFSRNGKVLENFTHITDTLASNINQFTESVVIDGEVISENFRALMKQVNRKEDVDAKDAILVAFDILPLDEFRKGIGTKTQKERRSDLVDFHKKVTPFITPPGSNKPVLMIGPQEEFDFDSLVGKIKFQEYHDQVVADGYEGTMIKDPDAVYQCKRNTNWLKKKPTISVTLKITKVVEGTGKNVGKFGAFECEGVDNGKFIESNVGSGFTDKDREEIWEARNSMPGQMIEVIADALSQNQDDPNKWSLRFPRFHSFRGFKVGEKC